MLYIFGVYLPDDSNEDTYIQELNHVESLYCHYRSYGNVIIAGDLNGSIISHLNTNAYKSQL